MYYVEQFVLTAVCSSFKLFFFKLIFFFTKRILFFFNKFELFILRIPVPK